MSVGFTHSIEIRTNETVTAERLMDLPNGIRRGTGWNYTCEKTRTGYCFNPSFRNMPYHNSFVPKIDVAITQSDGYTVLHLTGQPVEWIQVFTIIFCGFALVMHALLLAIMVFTNSVELFPLLLTLLMCAFGYFLCRLGTKYTFQNVVKTIENEFQ